MAFLETLAEENRSVAGHIKQGVIETPKGNEVSLAFDPIFTNHLDFLKDEENSGLAERVLSAVMNRTLRLRFYIKDKERKEKIRVSHKERYRNNENVEKNPLVIRLQEFFGDKIGPISRVPVREHYHLGMSQLYKEKNDGCRKPDETSPGHASPDGTSSS